MTLAEFLELQARALSVEDRKKLGAKLLANDSVATVPPRRRAGSAEGRVHMKADFDARLEDFAEYS